MEGSIFTRIDPSIICTFLLLLMLIMIAFGNRMRKKFWSIEEGDTKGGVNALLGALFGLWSFILAFTFGQSGTRFENVRAIIVEEANSLRTTIIRADLFPDSIRDVYRTDLRKYLEERIAYYEYAGNKEKFNSNREALSSTAKALWATTVQCSKRNDLTVPAAAMALNLTSLFDLGIKREAMLNAGIPIPISFLLIVLVLAISFVGGFTTPTIKRKEWLVIAVFALLATIVLYLTIDLARPMDGLIKPDTGQTTIVNLRQLF